MTEIKKVITKNGKVQYYEFSRFQFRSFRISAADAELKLATGESCLVDKFLHESVSAELFPEENKNVECVEVGKAIEEVKQDNVVSFTDKFKAKQEKTDLEKAKSHFINNILPNMSLQEKETVLNNPDMIREVLLNVMLRTTVEKM